MLGHRLRRWPNIHPALGECFVYLLGAQMAYQSPWVINQWDEMTLIYSCPSPAFPINYNLLPLYRCPTVKSAPIHGWQFINLAVQETHYCKRLTNRHGINTNKNICSIIKKQWKQFPYNAKLLNYFFNCLKLCLDKTPPPQHFKQANHLDILMFIASSNVLV